MANFFVIDFDDLLISYLNGFVAVGLIINRGFDLSVNI